VLLVVFLMVSTFLWWLLWCLRWSLGQCESRLFVATALLDVLWEVLSGCKAVESVLTGC